MEEKSLVVVEQPQNVQTANVLIIELFLNDNYRLRCNMLSGKVELGRALVSLDYERKEHSHVAYYKAVPLRAA
ncbi:MAG: hypothetical protein E7107_11200 [Prevotella sp.]|nr:hypothetical protein [Prevotella sp.]